MKQLQTVAKTIKEFTGTSGLYSSCVIDNEDEFAEWVSNLGMPLDELDELHVTVMYSPDVTPRRAVPSTARTTGIVIGVELFGPEGEEDTLVLTLNSPELARMAAQWTKRGCKSTFPDYRPHITLKKDAKPDAAQLVKWRSAIQCAPLFTVRFRPEVLEDIKDDAK